MGLFKGQRQENMENMEPEPEYYDDPQELLDAEERCPEVKFVKSCWAFYNKKGFLTGNQKNALKYAGTPNRKYRQRSGYDPE